MSLCHPVCALVRSPVWNNTGVNLTFHIPNADIKGLVKVCVLLPDGSCHGNAKITYRSSPSCTAFTPSSSWVRYDWICQNIFFPKKVVLKHYIHFLSHIPTPHNNTVTSDLIQISPAATGLFDSRKCFNKPNLRAFTIIIFTCAT